jgi:hypothetical protein
MRIVVTMPVYEDWDSALQLCQKIADVFRQEHSLQVGILLIDDGSTVHTPARDLSFESGVVETIAVLRLRRNLGHQRAIAVGLCHLQQHWHGDAIVVMDADGEDRPEDLPAFIAAMKQSVRPTAIFAERGKRLDTRTFRAFYYSYRFLHKILAGRDIRFGNFSLIPWAHLDSLVLFPELWNHYAASFLKAGLPYVRVRSDRGKRLAGKSKMTFVTLVVHGLSALFANQELVGVRLLLIILGATASLMLGVGAVVGVRLLTSLAIPGWATTAAGLLLILGTQALVGGFMLIFSIMMNRSHLGFLPIRDYAFFVRGEETLFPR